MGGALVFSVTPLTKSPVAEASANEIPELTLYQQDNGVKLEWAVEMLDSNILTSTSFENGEEIPDFNYKGLGGQSLSSEESFTGVRSAKIKETTNQGGNYFLQPNVNLPGYYSEYSWMTFEKKYVANGTPLSVSLRIKTDAENTQIKGIGTGSRGDVTLPIHEVYNYAKPITFLEPASSGDKVLKVSNVEQLAKRVNGGQSTQVANNYAEAGDYSYSTIQSIDVNKNTITLKTPIKQDFKVGDNVLGHINYNPVKFSYAQVSPNDGWKLINLNTNVENYSNYNTLLRGFDFRLQSQTSGTMYIDDVKFGYATEVELFKNNKQVYKGFLSDYEDTQAKDKVKPDDVADVNITFENGKPKASWAKPKDHGTTYSYSIRAIDNSGTPQQMSELQVIDVVSDIKGYSVVMDKYPTTIPDNTIDTEKPSFQHTDEIHGDFYVHVKAIDGAGNVSGTKHVLVSDTVAPTMTYQLSSSDLTNQDVVIRLNAADEGLGIKGILFPEGVWAYGEQASYTVTENGMYEFLAEDMLGNKVRQVVAVDNIDKVKPTIDAVSIENGYLNVITSDKGSYVKKTEVKRDNESYQNFESNKIKIIQNTEVSVRVTDAAGNITEESFSLTSDAYYQSLLEQIEIIQKQVESGGQTQKELIELLELVRNIQGEANHLVLPSELEDVKTKATELEELIQGILDALNKAKVELEDLGKNPTQLELDKAKEIIEALPPGPEKDKLLKDLEEKQKQINSGDGLLAKAEAAVKHAEEFPAYFNIERAEKAVHVLSNTPQKDALLERIQIIKDKNQFEEAEKKVEQAERYERDPYLADAIKLVDGLKDGEQKQNLKDRLQVILDKLKGQEDELANGGDGQFDPTDPDRSIGDAINTIRDLNAKNYLTRWHQANEHASNYFSRAMTANASKFQRELPTSYLNKASYSNLIAELTTRTESLATAWQEASQNKVVEQSFSKAYTLVNLYESSKTERNYNNAMDAIAVLPEGAAKISIEIQLESLKNHQEETAPTLNSKEVIERTEKAVANYEKFKSSYYQKKANEAIELMIDSEEKITFQVRMEAVIK